MKIFVITGAIQTGKTTWIGRMLERAAERGLAVSGVLAPAVFENGSKTGIDALLLPGGERFELGRKSAAFAQLAAEHGAQQSATANSSEHGAQQSAAASAGEHNAQRGAAANAGEGAAAAQRVRLAWGMDESALERINAHFRVLRQKGFGQLMVVDEFGPLEFSGNRGYTEGMAVMDAGLPANALLVLRPSLLDAARERWGEYELLGVESNIEEFLNKLEP